MSARLTLPHFSFRLDPGAAGLAEVIDLLKALLRHVDQPSLIVCDRLPARRSRLVREYIWSCWKQHELPSVCPKDNGELSRRARRELRRMQRKPRLLTAFWKQPSLCFDELCIMRDSIGIRSKLPDLEVQ